MENACFRRKSLWPMLKRLAARISHALSLERLIQSKEQNPWRVLMFHRVTPYSEFLEEGMFVTPETFCTQIEFLSSNYNICSLEEVQQGGARIALTFDDGWLDNYKYALPVLREYNCPATVFLPTRYVGTNEKFWTDLIDREKISEVKAMSKSERDDYIATLLDSQPDERSFLNWDEVREMAKYNIEFGSHSHAHEYQSELSASELEEDFFKSVGVFEAEGVPMSSWYCYPGGKWSPDSQRTLASQSVERALIVNPKHDFSETPKLYGRKSIHYGVAETKEELVFHLWVRDYLSLS